MIRINKNEEPDSWAAHRETEGSEYEATNDLRTALLIEQGYICAYCMRRIPVRDSVSSEESRIEHIQCRQNHPHLQLEYKNMLVCCPGCINGEEHCDKSKGNKDIHFSLFTDALPKSITYSSKDGHIRSLNAEWDKDINEVLSLNNIRLKNNRLQVIEGIIQSLNKAKWKTSELEQKLEEWTQKDFNGRLKPYCGVVIAFLIRKIREKA